jgi:hypothetical protein
MSYLIFYGERQVRIQPHQPLTLKAIRRRSQRAFRCNLDGCLLWDEELGRIHRT